MSNDNALLWLRLQQTPGIGPRTALKLCAYFNNITTLFEQPSSALIAAGLTLEQVQYLQGSKFDQYYEQLLRSDIALITYDSSCYPAALKNIYDPPLVLHLSGDSKLLATKQIAIVGSRKATDYGKRCTTDIAKQLAQRGLTVTSGFAIGIDYYAHLACVANNLPTIAVLGCGIDQHYPANHWRLQAQILASGGAVVSEFLLGTTPTAYNFPRRNRLISGLTLGTVVIEAAQNSGSLLTAKLALEQGKEVFAVPGSIYNINTQGCHNLIKQGAKLVHEVNDILVELPNITNDILSSTINTAAQSLISISPGARKILPLLSKEPQGMDALVMQSGCNVITVSTSLVELELLDLCQQITGGYISNV